MVFFHLIKSLLINKLIVIFYILRRIDDDQGKSYELGQSAVKCMRGILQCWIKQAHKIELFKKKQCNAHSLHSKFHLVTGDEICSETYPNLQVCNSS